MVSGWKLSTRCSEAIPAKNARSLSYRFWRELIRASRSSFCVLRISASPGNVTPPHLHRTTDETFLIESGEVEVNLGGELLQGRPGDVIYLPKGIAHAPLSVPANARRANVSNRFIHYLAVLFSDSLYQFPTRSFGCCSNLRRRRRCCSSARIRRMKTTSHQTLSTGIALAPQEATYLAQ